MITNIYRALILLLCICLFSCIKEDPDTRLEVEVQNETNGTVQLMHFSRYPPSDVADTSIVNILSGGNYIWTMVSRGESSQYPTGLQKGALYGDSLHVIFGDTLSVTHYFFSVRYDSTEIDSAVIEYNEPRNIYNPDNYSKEKLDKNYFRGTYTVTEADLDYALSIHEQKEVDFILPNIYTLSSLETMLKLNLASGITQKHISLYFQYYYDYL